MDTTQLIALIAAAIVTLGGGGAGVRHLRSKSAVPTDTTDVLLARIGELEAALASERARTVQLEGQVIRLRDERRILADRVSHLEGQVSTLTELVQHLVDKQV